MFLEVITVHTVHMWNTWCRSYLLTSAHAITVQMAFSAQGHALVELLLLVVLAMDLAMRMRWLKWHGVVKYNPRVIFKVGVLPQFGKFAQAIVFRECFHTKLSLMLISVLQWLLCSARPTDILPLRHGH